MKTMQEIWNENGQVPIRVNHKEWDDDQGVVILGQAPMGLRGFYGYDENGYAWAIDPGATDYHFVEVIKPRKRLRQALCSPSNIVAAGDLFITGNVYRDEEDAASKIPFGFIRLLTDEEMRDGCIYP